jgi:hypothetical protein
MNGMNVFTCPPYAMTLTRSRTKGALGQGEESVSTPLRVQTIFTASRLSAKRRLTGKPETTAVE